jgi:uncharacterized protein YbjT (DUF2867 family)
MMRVAIAGGHGKVGLALARLLRDRGDQPVCLIRNPDQAGDVRDAGGEPFLADLEADDGDLADAMAGADAVVFAAGAGPGSGAERKWTMDYGGAVKLIDAASEAGTGRYLMVSSMRADPEAEGEDTFSVYLRAKGKADAALVASGLDYTIVRPGRLTDDPGTGRVELGSSVSRGEIPREDVAAVLIASLHEPATEGRIFEATAGDTAIEEAIAALSSA